MKFYESTFEEYLQRLRAQDFHPEIAAGVAARLPEHLEDMPNLLFYGPSGAGKYSQALRCIARYSPTSLKYQKKTSALFNKQTYLYHLSDVHFEVDMALLGCNSKLLWHEIYSQVTDTVAVKQRRVGVIVCKNFHAVHNELIEIFYSYMQQYNNRAAAIAHGRGMLIKFVLISEHIGFLPCSILQSCFVVRVKRPRVIGDGDGGFDNLKRRYFGEIAAPPLALSARAHDPLNLPVVAPPQKVHPKAVERASAMLSALAHDPQNLHFASLPAVAPPPRVHPKGPPPRVLSALARDPQNLHLHNRTKAFSIVCDALLQQMLNAPQKFSLSLFRESIYDIFTYNLDVRECVWYLLQRMAIQQRSLTSAGATNAFADIVVRMFQFFQYFNNNYRPIYHLEGFFIYCVLQLHFKPDESRKGVPTA